MAMKVEGNLDDDAQPGVESVRVHPALRENASHGCLDAAAAAIAVLLLRPSRTDDLVLPGSELREPPITVVGGPALIAPRGRVAAVTNLTWSHVPRAARYRFRVYDSAGTAVWENETTDT